MTHASKPAGTAVIIPIDVRAFCVGDRDRTDGSGFSGITLDYSRMEPADSTKGAAIISDSNEVARDQTFTPLSPLDTGVHLHWNLPRALTHGVVSQDTQEAEFPLVPNRWLVARLAESFYRSQANRAWIVESDHIDTQPGEGLASVSLFVGYDQDPPYRYLGRTIAADYDWSEPEPGPQPSQLKMLTQSDLTAVHSGDPLFASYYPNCRNIFGMRDDCADIALADDLSVTYVVVGWYSRPENDPLHDGLTPRDLLERFNWQLSGNTPGMFHQSFYMGVVQAVSRKPGRSYVSAPGGSPVSAGVGASGVEALSALLAAQAGDNVNRETLEEVLTAYQLGGLSGLYVPQPDRFADLRDQLHGAGFGHTPAGSVWTLTQGKDTNQATPLGQLPANLAAALATLNTIQRRYDQHMIAADGLRMQLYLDWYRAGAAKIAYDDTGTADNLTLLNAARTYTSDTIEFLFRQPEGQAITDPLGLSIALREAHMKLMVQAEQEGWALKLGNAPWYWRPNDPVLAMTGTDTAHRLRNNGLDTVVRCRLAQDLISEITIQGKPLGDVFTLGIYPPENSPVPQACWVEALLLNTKILGVVSGVPPKMLAQSIQSLLQTQQDNVVITGHQGVPPDPQALQLWDSANPWLPLFMWWTATFHPAPGYSGDYQGGGDADNVPTGYVTTNFTLGSDGTMWPQGWTTPGAARSFLGRAILTPFSTQSLVAALQNDPFVNDPEDPELASDAGKILAYLQGKPVLYQALSGLMDGLLNLNDTPQLAGASTDGDSVQSSINGDHGLFHQVNDAVRGAHRRGAHPNSAFFPVRGGFLDMQLSLVDVYGQRRQVAFTSFNCATAMRTGDSESRQQAYLAPRLTQAARLCFDYLPAAFESAETQATLLDSPLCGWLVPNHLDDALAVYDEKGVPRGMLFAASGNVEWIGAPGSPYYGLPLSGGMAGTNAYLANMVTALQGGSVARLQSLMTCVMRIANSTTGAMHQDPAVATLIGRPIAVVPAVLRMELCGFPAVNQSWPAFKTDYNASRRDRANPLSYLQRVDAGVRAVNFDVVLGNMARFADGLFGFFQGSITEPGGRPTAQYDFATFHSPAAGTGLEGVADSRLVLSPSGQDIPILMLVDPLSKVHAVSGVLPTQTLSLQHDLVLPFLNDLSVTFPVRPLLSDSGGLDIPLPVKHGYAWSWVQREGDGWTVTPIADMPSAKAAPTTPQQLYSGWLKLVRQET